MKEIEGSGGGRGGEGENGRKHGPEIQFQDKCSLFLRGRDGGSAMNRDTEKRWGCLPRPVGPSPPPLLALDELSSLQAVE